MLLHNNTKIIIVISNNNNKFNIIWVAVFLLVRWLVAFFSYISLFYSTITVNWCVCGRTYDSISGIVWYYYRRLWSRSLLLYVFVWVLVINLFGSLLMLLLLLCVSVCRFLSCFLVSFGLACTEWIITNFFSRLFCMFDKYNEQQTHLNSTIRSLYETTKCTFTSKSAAATKKRWKFILYFFAVFKSYIIYNMNVRAMREDNARLKI